MSARLGLPLPADGGPPGYRLWRWRGSSVLVLRRSVVVLVGMVAVTLLAAGVAFAVGSADLNPLSALRAAAGVGEADAVFIVRELRLPRVVRAVLVGLALGIGGCLMQTVARNRLATPGIVGIDNGATAFAVASVVGVTTSFVPYAMSLIGSVTALALVMGLSGGSGTRGYRFIVVGIGVGAMFGALTSYMLARAPIDASNATYAWTVGSLNARSGDAMRVLLIGLAVGIPIAIVLGRQLVVMRMSDAVAVGLGVRVRIVRLVALAVAIVLSALSVSVAGPVGLIALVGPETARYLSGPRGVPVIASGVAGALYLILADVAGRTLFTPVEIPVGVVTAVVGGPYLLWILLRSAPGRL